MRNLNLMPKGLPGLYGNLISGLTGKIPDWAKDLTQEELMGIATSGPYLSQQKSKYDASKFGKGENLLGRVTEGQSILNTGNFPQSEYNRLFPSNIPPPSENDGSQILPYPYNVQQFDDNDEVADETTFDYRFGNPNENQALDVTRGSYIFNQGGRVPRAFGGIMDTATGRKAYGLGSIFKSVAKAAKKVLSSDVGKLAIMGAGIYYGGGGRMPFTEAFKSKGFGGFGVDKFFSKANPLLFTEGKFNPMKMAGLITAGGALAGPAKVDTLPDSGTRGGHLIDPLTGKEGTMASMRENIELAKLEAGDDPVKLAAIDQKYNNMLNLGLPDNLPYPNYGVYANGGRIRAEEGGLMDLGGMEKDYRAEGGFVPIGKAEKADDVPARLSVNEFVFTADAVRNAGGGDIDKGAEVMENMMKNLENGGRVSEESQGKGNTGAQEMFSVSERIGEVI